MNDFRRTVLLVCALQFDAIHLRISFGVFFYGKNSKNIINIKSGKYPQKRWNIATTKLIQWGDSKMAENKAFCGFYGFIFFAC